MKTKLFSYRNSVYVMILDCNKVFLYRMIKHYGFELFTNKGKYLKKC